MMTILKWLPFSKTRSKGVQMKTIETKDGHYTTNTLKLTAAGLRASRNLGLCQQTRSHVLVAHLQRTASKCCPTRWGLRETTMIRISRDATLARSTRKVRMICGKSSSDLAAFTASGAVCSNSALHLLCVCIATVHCCLPNAPGDYLVLYLNDV